jgi:hypothetical protein
LSRASGPNVRHNGTPYRHTARRTEQALRQYSSNPHRSTANTRPVSISASSLLSDLAAGGIDTSVSRSIPAVPCSEPPHRPNGRHYRVDRAGSAPAFARSTWTTPRVTATRTKLAGWPRHRRRGRCGRDLARASTMQDSGDTSVMLEVYPGRRLRHQSLRRSRRPERRRTLSRRGCVPVAGRKRRRVRHRAGRLVSYNGNVLSLLILVVVKQAPEVPLKYLHLLDDLLGGRGPLERLGVCIPVRGEVLDASDQVWN